ncbi:p21-activated protein kinase-interacting protein 1-like [Bagarius yarrelli]|uniref:p21-activated protein kinase-interacting protein 1-like n=1 Tax=Bagarius yarrelli TaxID=175774 RepID=A0A556U1K3_BAGYA|nr:p21-activated protein kinase-interacting protein 1-like [Bagarius yarrelli]
MAAEVIVGSYEQIVFGYRVCPKDGKQFVATGSKDETVQLYNMRTRTEHGALLHHDGHVTSVSIHPSGKLALSVGTDKKLRTWNLIEGRAAFTKNIRQNAQMVRWSPAGDKYAVVVNEKVDVYDLESASVVSTFSYRKRISSVRFLKNTLLAVTGDDEHVQVYDLTSEKCICEFKAHENRVKALDSFQMNDVCVLVTASNDGFIKLWDFSAERQEAVRPLGQVNTTARLTCLSVWKNSGEEEKSDTQPTTSQPDMGSLLPPKNKRVRIHREEVIVEEDSSSKKQGKKKKKQKVQ